MPKRAPRAERPSRPSKKLVDLIKLHRQKRAIGAKFYGQADELLEGILQQVKPDKKVPMGNGLFAVVHDQFASGGKVFKPVFVSRYELQIVDAEGNVTRMRDAKGRTKGQRKRF